MQNPPPFSWVVPGFAVLAVGVFAVLLGTSGTGLARAQDASGDPLEWYRPVRAAIEDLFGEISARLSTSTADLPDGSREQVRALAEGHVRGVLANLDVEIGRVAGRVSELRVEHGPQEDHFCSPDNSAFRLFDSVGDDPSVARDALVAGFQCRAAYRGAVSTPVLDEVSSLRERCFLARDRLVDHHDDPTVVRNPARAAVYAVEQCAAWQGAAWTLYSVTGSDPGSFYGDEGAGAVVLDLTARIVRGEFSDP